MTITDEILILANRLANQGKKPTVALIKGKLRQSAPLPVLINTLKQWQHEPDFINLDNVTAETQTIKESNQLSQAISNEIESAVKQALQPLKIEIFALKKQVEQLKEQLN